MCLLCVLSELDHFLSPSVFAVAVVWWRGLFESGRETNIGVAAGLQGLYMRLTTAPQHG